MNKILLDANTTPIIKDSVNDMIIILTGLSAEITNNDIIELLTPDDKKRYDIDRLQSIINKSDSDINVLLHLFKNFLNLVNKDNIFDFDTNITHLCNYKNTDRKVMRKIIIDYEFNDSNEKRDKLVDELIIFILNRYDNLIRGVIREFIKRYLNIDIDTKIENKFISFIKMYLRMNDCIKSLYYANSRDINYTNDIIKYSQKYKSYNVDDTTKLSFLLANPYNIVKQIETTKNYISLFNIGLDNIYTIRKLKAKTKSDKTIYIDSTFIDSIYKSNCLLYLSLDVSTDSIKTLIYIPESYLKYIKLYSKDKLKLLIARMQKSIDKYYQKIDFEVKNKIPHTNFENGVNLYMKTLNKVINTLN